MTMDHDRVHDRDQARKDARPRHTMRRSVRLLLAATIATAALGGAHGQDMASALPARASFEKIFMAAFSHVLTPQGGSQPLASTMVVHNVDPAIEITVSTADYLDQNGNPVKSFLKTPIKLAPRASHAFLVKVNEQPAGFSARFVLEWSADEQALSPILQGVMIGGAGTQGISFTTVGRVVERRP